MFDNFNGGWLLPLLAGVLLWFVFSTMLNRGQHFQTGGGWSDQAFDEKPKRDFADDKPKRDRELLYRDDGDVLEIVDPPDTHRGDENREIR